MKKLLLLLLIANAFSSVVSLAYGQCSNSMPFITSEVIYTNPINGISISPEADKLDRPYVFTASVAGGVQVFHRTGMGSSLQLFATIPTTSLGNLYAINLYQDSGWLYVALGDIWDTTAQMAGLAIIDVSDLFSISVTDVYTHPGMPLGAGAVIVRDNIAYLAANQNGLVLLDVSNKTSIQLISDVTFANNFPHSPGQTLDHWKYNARGIDLKDHYAFVCYDRGGLRVVDIADSLNPVQVNQYCNPDLIDHATAYNNIVINDTLAYVAIDYYGMEILSISNPLSINPVGWWHPSNWAPATNNLLVWGAAKGHANEIAYNSECQKVYIAAGKTDAMSIDVSDPSNPVSCDSIGTITDDYGTWGLDFYNHELFLGYIWAPVTPPFSNYTGVKIAQTSCGLGLDPLKPSHFVVSPNPVNQGETIHLFGISGTISISTALGEELYHGFINQELTLPITTAGAYFIRIVGENGWTETRKLIVQ